MNNEMDLKMELDLLEDIQSEIKALYKRMMENEYYNNIDKEGKEYLEEMFPESYREINDGLNLLIPGLSVLYSEIKTYIADLESQIQD